MLHVGVIGFGTVGSGIYERLLNSKEELQTIFQNEVQVTKILVKDDTKDRGYTHVNALITSDPNEFFNQQYDVVFEAIGGVEPAKGYIVKLMQSGTSIITANKELIAKHGKELEELAGHYNVYLGVEAAVGGGIPIVNSFKTLFSTTPIHSVTGILNGTTNYILTEMKEKNRTFADVLAEAKELGYAEADPTDDIEGYDALYKIQILSRLAFNSWPNETNFSCKGISVIEEEAINFAERNELAIKLIAKTSIENGVIRGFVSPSFVAKDHPLYNVNGVTNGVCIDGETIDRITMCGPGAGKDATANSMVEDFVLHEQFQGFSRPLRQQFNETANDGMSVIVFVSDLEKQQLNTDLISISSEIEVETGIYEKQAVIFKLAEGKSLNDLPLLLQQKSYPVLGKVAVNKLALPF
ncbi:homoserine dehydrogenase [Alkalihalobacterium sp. APHAB7]|uniref:homoserine dehydrogenase n=1 Tax=Alkalihalobacterium sp. APHAB7 TaxID=3402081 RepID=UPI003AAC5EF9